jgi:hypothetical protein
MTILEARGWVGQFARNPGIYDDEERDRAIQVLGNDFILHTLMPRITGDITVTAGSAAIDDFTADAGDLTGFRPERLLRAYLPGLDAGSPDRAWLDVSDYARILEERTRCPRDGIPTAIGFESSSSALVNAAPTADLVIRFLWVPPFTPWTAGSSDGDVLATELNIPTDQLQQALTYGATAFLQHNEPESQYAVASWQKYIAYRDDAAAKAGGLGGGRTRMSSRFVWPDRHRGR